MYVFLIDIKKANSNMQTFLEICNLIVDYY